MDSWDQNKDPQTGSDCYPHLFNNELTYTNQPLVYNPYDNGYNSFVQPPYPPNQSQNYVGFNQFLTQFQNQNWSDGVSNAAGPCNEASFGTHKPTEYDSRQSNRDVVNSNLTPTATEFVPKIVSSEYNAMNKEFENVPPVFENTWKPDITDLKNDARDRPKKNDSRKEMNYRARKNEFDKRVTNKSSTSSSSTDWRRDDRSNTKFDADVNVINSERFDRQERDHRNGDEAFNRNRNRNKKYNEQTPRQIKNDEHEADIRRRNEYERSGPNDRYFREEKFSNNSEKDNRYNADRRDDNYQRERDNYEDHRNRDRDSYRDDYNRDKNNDRYQRRGNEQEDYRKKNNSREDPDFRRDRKDYKKYENKPSFKFNGKFDKTDAVESETLGSQRERLMILLDKGTLECLVCCERVKPQQTIWSCPGCYHVLHLNCTVKWAATSKADLGWRCPACQRISSSVPHDYYCFCGKMRDPPWHRGSDAAHTCGEPCGRPGPDPCPHQCTLLCHPGPCPPCQAQRARQCGCGRTTRTVQCSHSDPLFCDAFCDKVLNCGEHRCAKSCHDGPCDDCSETITQECYCKGTKREVACTSETAGVLNFECGNPCKAKLSCLGHECPLLCHPGECPSCVLDPDLVKTCPCGKKNISPGTRLTCLDPVEICEAVCDKALKCGPPSQPHRCKVTCHTGPCPVCPMETLVRCRCGHMDREIPCSELTTRADDARCQKKCTKKRECGRHKCNAFCCIALDHPCPLPCTHTLSCGLHKCEQNCHKGRCQPCWRSSFEELYCECGAAVLYPPVACGTRKPHCERPCSREHPCSHPVMHNCHSDATCPPCTVLCSKLCHGGHEMRKTIPCHQEDFSCGKPCGRPISCGWHTCQAACHPGPCVKDGPVCTQPCPRLRTVCDHPCAAPCHDGACQNHLTACKEMVKVTCGCGHRSTTRACTDTARDYQSYVTAMLASQLADVQRGQTVNIQDMISYRLGGTLKTLECTDECRMVERNRRLTVGLQIRNPDLSAKLCPRYSEFLKQWAKKDPSFVQNIHEKLTDLVHLAKQSKQKNRSHSFPTMNREKRQVVHEMCEQFGIDGKAYDAEPNRNVVATADKEKSWLPSLSLFEVLQRENGQRKVPMPSMGAVKKPPKFI